MRRIFKRFVGSAGEGWVVRGVQTFVLAADFGGVAETPARIERVSTIPTTAQIIARIFAPPVERKPTRAEVMRRYEEVIYRTFRADNVPRALVGGRAGYHCGRP